MATVRILNNILDDKVDTFSVEAGITVETLIREHTTGDSYDGVMVECYDCDTGETFFAPIEDDTATCNAIVQVNQKDVGLDYVLRENDIVSVVITPAGGDVDVGWNWWGALGGFVAGTLSGALYGLIASGPWGALAGGIVGGIIGFFAGGLIVGTVENLMKPQDSDSSSSSGIDSENLPDVRGSQNQPLTDNVYPMVLGKHLATPFIIGSPWNEISGAHGEDNYIHCLYAVGYAPLRLTDFKLGDIMLAHNQQWSGNKDLLNIWHGPLHGTDSNTSAGNDLGDIVSTWANNDITLEILQQGQNGQAIDYGTVYPYAKIQEEIKANVLYVVDGTLSEIDSENSISYKGLGLANGLRNNPIRFTEQFPKSARVELDFQSGLYKTRSETVDDDSSVHYYRIPMWVAIQWRVYSKDNESGNGNYAGNDIPLPDYDYDNKCYKPLAGRALRGWHSFGSVNGIGVSRYTYEERYNDIAAHTGNSLRNQTGFEIIRYIKRTAHYRCNPDGSGWYFISGDYLLSSFTHVNYKYYVGYTPEYDVVYNSYESYQDAYHALKQELSLPPVRTGYIMEYEGRKENKDYYKVTGITVVNILNSYFADINDGWIGAEVFNLQPLGGTDSEHDGINEFRCVTEVDFVQWASDNLLAPEERAGADKDTILAEKFRAYFLDSSNTAKSVEVRVVRVSPCYLDETKSNKDHSAFKFNDIFTWTTLTSTMLDGDQLLHENKIVQKRPLDEERMRKLCVVAIKAKTDNTDQMGNTLKKFSCTAQSFAPYYDDNKKKWFPEKVEAVTKYYRPSYRDEEDPTVWHGGDQITREEFEADRQGGVKSLRMPAGNDFVRNMVSEVIRTGSHIDERGRYYIPNDDVDEDGNYQPGCDGTLRYCDNNVASVFLLAGIGPHLGIDALGYTQKFYDKDGNLIGDGAGDFNMPALAKWYKWAERVTDGSTYNSDGYHYLHDGTYVQHAKCETVEMYFTANAYIYQAVMLESMLAKIAVAGRAVYTRDQKNRLTVIVDKPEKHPVALISQQNTLKSSYTLSFADNPSGLQINYPDEDDGYNTNALYCMADGEDEKNPRAAIEQYKFDYVTNNHQQWSLGRYLLANRLLNKEVVTKQIGVEGASIGLGSLVLLQDDTMLIGTDTGGRITQLIENDHTIYGFIIDNTYHYTGEEETVKDDKGKTVYEEDGVTPVTQCVQGVVVMQPSQYKESRVITLRLAKAGTKYAVGDTTYEAVRGNTNVVLFEKGISKTDDSANGDTVFVYKPKVDNIVGFGIVGKMTSTYRVIKIKPDAKRNYEFTLMKYQDDLYEYGDVLPSFQNNMTIPDRSGEDAFALSNNVTHADLVKALAESSELAKGRIDDTFGYAPPVPDNLTADVKQDCVQFTCTVDSDKVNNIDHITYEITKADGTTATIDGSYSTEYYFDRNVDGFPEKDELSEWKFRAKAVSIYLDDDGNRYESDWSDYVYPTEKSLSEYGTWIPPQPKITSFVAYEDGITAVWSCDLTRVYGSVQFEFSPYYDGTLRETQVVITKGATYQFNRNIDGYPEKPDTVGMRMGTLTLDKYSAIVKAVNITSGRTSESDETFCDYSKYKTWIPSTPTISARVSNRNITLYLSQDAECYGLIQYLVGVRRYDDPTDTFYVPDLETNPYSRESAYKLQEDGVFIVGKRESESQYTQTMPLETQNGIQGMLDTDESDEDDRILAVPVESSTDNRILVLGLGGYAPIDTAYQFEVYAFNKTVENFYDSLSDVDHNYDKDTYHKVSVYGARRNATALTTSVQDVLNGSIVSEKVGVGAITETKIDDDAVSTPKLQANAVVADKIYTYNLVALTQGVHSISGFAASEENDEDFLDLVRAVKSNNNVPVYTRGYLYNNVFYLDRSHTTVIAGQSGKTYADITDAHNVRYYEYTAGGYVQVSGYTTATEQIDKEIKKRSSNYWIGLDTDKPEFYMGNMLVGEKYKEAANYFHYYFDNDSGDTNLDIKLSNFIVTAVSSTIKGYFNVRNKNGDTKYIGANSFLQVNPETKDATLGDSVKGYYYDGKFYENSAHTVEIAPDKTVVFEDITDPNSHQFYQWDGTAYYKVNATDTETMALKGDFLITTKNSDGSAGTLTVQGLSKLLGGLSVGTDDGSLAGLTARIFGTLGVSGNTTLNGGLKVPNKKTTLHSLSVTNTATTKELIAQGDTDSGDTTEVALQVGSDTLHKVSAFYGSVTVSDDLTVNGTLSVPNKKTTLHSLEVTNATTLKGTLTAEGLATFNNLYSSGTIKGAVISFNDTFKIKKIELSGTTLTITRA